MSKDATLHRMFGEVHFDAEEENEAEPQGKFWRGRTLPKGQGSRTELRSFEKSTPGRPGSTRTMKVHVLTPGGASKPRR